MGQTDRAVVCLGAAAVDMMFTVDKLPEADEMVFAKEAGFLLQEGQLPTLQLE